MNDMPTIREELDRKSYETIEWLATSLKRGKLTEQQFAVGIESVFMTVSGLVDEQVIEVITEASRVASNVSGDLKRNFVLENVVVTLYWRTDEDYFAMTKLMDGSPISVDFVSGDTPEMALKRMQYLAEKLVSKGYREL